MHTGVVFRVYSGIRSYRPRNPTPQCSWSVLIASRIPICQSAAQYITKLPKAEHEAPEWQAAMQALILVATHGGPTMFARIGVMLALNRHVERVFDTSRKPHHWGKRKLKRDQ
jgi:hypothetical protein